MTRQSIDMALPVGEPILLDTTAIIAYLSRGAGGETISGAAAYVLDELVRTGRNAATVSAVTVMEALVRPIRLGTKEQRQHVVDFLSNFPNLQVLSVDFDVAEKAAVLRATYNLATPDALIVASGLLAGARHIVTNDDEWRRKLNRVSERITVCYLEEHLPFA